MFDAIIGVLKESLGLLYLMSPYLLFGFLFAGVLHALVSIDWIARHLGKSGVGSVIKAVILGIPLPLCSCGVIPAAVMLNKKGASRGAVTSFLIATPITGVDAIFATYSLLGFAFTVFRVIASSVTAFVAGILGNFVGGDERAPADLTELEHQHGSCDVEEKPARKIYTTDDLNRVEIGPKIRRLFRYAFVELLGDIWFWLVVGLLVAGVISYYVPQTFVEKYLGSPFLSMIIMLIVGIPMYVCSTGSIPIAAALMLKGMSPGAALVFLLAGPATNAVTMTVIGKELGKKATIVYVGTIAVMALIFGFIVNRAQYIWSFEVRHMEPGMEMIPHWLELVCTVVLVILILHVIIRGYIRTERAARRR